MGTGVNAALPLAGGRRGPPDETGRPQNQAFYTVSGSVVPQPADNQPLSSRLNRPPFQPEHSNWRLIHVSLLLPVFTATY